MEIIKVNRDFEQIAKIEEIYNYSFPENERLAFSDILDKKAPDSSLYAFFDGADGTRECEEPTDGRPLFRHHP